MRLSDYVVRSLADWGVEAAFLVAGGFALHLNDALAAEPRVRKICCHHEQGAAYAAEGYGHVAGRPALLQLTAGPGSINAMSGVFGAYTDSIPLVVVSGQGRREVIRSSYGFEGMRQICDQEADVVAMARPITKYAREVSSPGRVAFELEKAWHLAVSGRPGPVWLEIPLDVQAAEVEPADLAHYRMTERPRPDARAEAASVLAELAAARRPLVVIGPDLAPRLRPLFDETARALGCPVVAAGAGDALLNDHGLYAGRLGILGTRAGNVAVRNADAILFLAMRPHLGLVTYAWGQMGGRATKIVVDEDPLEFEKPCCVADRAIVCQPEHIMAELLAQAGASGLAAGLGPWREHCRRAVAELDALPETMRRLDGDGAVNPYWLADTLSGLLRDDDVIVMGNSSSSVVPLQATAFRGGQRLFSNHGNGAMGFALPAAMGACLASPGRRVVCLEGDGSLMMNLQELQTVAHHGLPLVLIVLDNGGYASIRQSQKAMAHPIGHDAASGVSFPDLARVAGAFGLPVARVGGPDFAAGLEAALRARGPLVVVARLDPGQGFEPKVASRRLPGGAMLSSPPHDMSPPLPREVMGRHLLSPGGDE
ncbi:MAG: thiamine pyrophosphate-binding protein [Deltaproteobacteria bacterium]|nr:thiamine pyrophosphate-binding protein [Deltaproteobacteria bacterium]